MGNNQSVDIEQNINKEWKLIRVTPNIKTYQHIFSHDLCELVKIDNVQVKELENYSSRKSYSFQHTPIIYNYKIVKEIKNCEFLSLRSDVNLQVLVQSTQHRLSDFPQINNNILEEGFLLRKFEQILLGFQYLFNKFGSFRIFPNQIGWTSNRFIKVWINSNFALNKVSNIYKIVPNEQTMIKQLFSLFKLIVPFQPASYTFHGILNQFQAKMYKKNTFDNSQFNTKKLSNCNSQMNLPKNFSKSFQGSFYCNNQIMLKNQLFHYRERSGNLPVPKVPLKFSTGDQKYIKNYQNNIKKISHQDSTKQLRNTENKYNQQLINPIQFNPQGVIQSIVRSQYPNTNLKNRKFSFKNHCNQIQIRKTKQSINISQPPCNYYSQRLSSNQNSRSIINQQLRNTHKKFAVINNFHMQDNLKGIQHYVNNSECSTQQKSNSIPIKNQLCFKKSNIKTIDNSLGHLLNNQNKFTTNGNNQINQYSVFEGVTSQKYYTNSDSKLVKKCAKLIKFNTYQKYKAQSKQQKPVHFIFQDNNIDSKIPKVQPLSTIGQIKKYNQQEQLNAQRISNISQKLQVDLEALFSFDASQNISDSHKSYNQLRQQLDNILEE